MRERVRLVSESNVDGFVQGLRWKRDRRPSHLVRGHRSVVSTRRVHTPPDPFFADWESESARTSFAGGAVLEAALLALACPDSLVRSLVCFKETKSRLEAAITEFVTFTLKEGKSMDQLEPILGELEGTLLGSRMYHGFSWAPIVNRQDAYHGILGWDTVEVRDKKCLVSGILFAHGQV